jgi:electron transfer flavoprotein beta subunit
LAELLGLTCATTLVSFALDGGVVTAKRELEGGVKGVVRFRLPALVTCQLGLNTPRYPTLPNIMKAKKKEMISLPVASLLASESFTATERLYPPTKKGSGLVLEGDLSEMADRLVSILKEKTTVLS